MPQISKQNILTGTHPTPHTVIWKNPMGMTIFPGTIKSLLQNNTRPLQDTAYSDEIPQLETDWDNGQFTEADTNLINRHKTHSESERIRKEYIQHLHDLSDNQYYSEENSLNQLLYSSPDHDYYGTLLRRLQNQPHDPNGLSTPGPSRCSVLAFIWKRKTHTSPQT